MMQRLYTTLLLGTLLCLFLPETYAQSPVISLFSPAHAPFHEVVNISGKDFPTQANLRVHFGSATATVLSASTTNIEVSVPAGATFAPVTVTNLSNGLSSTSAAYFMPSFGGTGLDPSRLNSKLTLAGQAGLKQLAVGDLDNDGLNDIAYSATTSTAVVLFRNTSSPGATSFSAFPLNLTATSRGLIIADLNGDGRPELIYTGMDGGGNLLFLLKNNSSPGSFSFSAPSFLTTPTNGATRLEVRDLNSDGKPEIIVSDEITSRLYIFINKSTTSSVSFQATPISISLPGANVYGLQLQDLNDDGKPDIITANYLIGEVFYLLNESTSTSIGFGSAQKVLAGIVGSVEIRMGDLNADGKADIVLADNFSGQIVIGINQSSGSSVTFSAAHKISLSSPGVWDISLGDLNGDGRADIAASHQNTAKCTILINEGFTTTPAFQAFSVNTTGPGTAIKIADFDNDARPDILYSNVLNNTLSILRNTNCPIPVLQQKCTGAEVKLFAPKFPLANYNWIKDGNPFHSGSSETLVLSETGNYTVTLTLPDGCSNTSVPLAVSNISGIAGNPVFEPITPICEGQNLKLTISAPVSGATYTWSNEGGFSSTTSTSSLSIPAANASHAGIYKVIIKAGDCQLSLLSPGPASILPPPAPVINPSTTVTQCTGQMITLSVPGTYATYQWKKDGQVLTGKTANVLSISEAGDYSVVVSLAGSCTGESQVFSYQPLALPSPSFSSPATVCLGQSSKFTNTSTAASGQDVRYLWDFGDGTTSTAKDPLHLYTSTVGSTYTVSLQVGYGSSYSCARTYTQFISVVAAEAVSLHASETAFCEGGEVEVWVEGNVESVQWSDEQQGSRIAVRQGGTLEATIITSSGCTLSRSIELESWPKPMLQLNADRTEIGLGESATLTVSGGLTYLWSPAESLDDAGSAAPVATPKATTTYTVTSISAEGCVGSAEIIVKVSSDFTVMIPKIFVPHIDGVWYIQNIESYPAISLQIINSLGYAVMDARPYLNTWDGSQRGNPLPAGVYYYIFKDEKKKVVRSGSITLMR